MQQPRNAHDIRCMKNSLRGGGEACMPRSDTLKALAARSKLFELRAHTLRISAMKLPSGPKDARVQVGCRNQEFWERHLWGEPSLGRAILGERHARGSLIPSVTGTPHFWSMASSVSPPHAAVLSFGCHGALLPMREARGKKDRGKHHSLRKMIDVSYTKDQRETQNRALRTASANSSSEVLSSGSSWNTRASLLMTCVTRGRQAGVLTQT